MILTKVLLLLFLIITNVLALEDTLKYSPPSAEQLMKKIRVNEVIEILEKGEKALKNKKHRDAIELLKRGLKKYYNLSFNNNIYEAKIYGQLGKAYFAIGEYANSISTLSRAYLLCPTNSGHANNYAYSIACNPLSDTFELILAESLVEKAIKRFPKYAAFHGTLGKIYFAQKKYSEAEKEVKIALELLPDDKIKLLKPNYKLLIELYMVTNNKEQKKIYQEKLKRLQD